jgi:protein transport protein SEC31
LFQIVLKNYSFFSMNALLERRCRSFLPQDSDLLLSCGKDNRILCWNPNSNQPGGEILCELASSNQWSFDVSWCPRNPAVVASSSFEGRVSIYSLMGGQEQVKYSFCY